MARAFHLLTAREVAALKKPGRHSDGGGLYLSISSDGSRRRWVFLFRWKETSQQGPGKLREKGLGSAGSVGLKEARDLAAKCRDLIRRGINPLEGETPERAIPTFGQMADEYIAEHESGWRNPKHRMQWRMTLGEYAKPLRELPVNVVTTEDVLGVLKPHWKRVPETAVRMRGRIENVLDAAKAKGFRAGDNPARWRGNLAYLLPSQPKLQRGHHEALPFPEIPELIRRLRASGSISALCLEFTILTAARSGESMGARWSEFDLDLAIWKVPGSRMKAGRNHSVPLSKRALEIVKKLAETPVCEFVFPGQSRTSGDDKVAGRLSVMAMEMVMRRMKVDATVHGFRSSFADWADESTGVARQVSEAALAHTLKDKVEAAYHRTTMFEKRRILMQEWANHCEPKVGQIAHEFGGDRIGQ